MKVRFSVLATAAAVGAFLTLPSVVLADDAQDEAARKRWACKLDNNCGDSVETPVVGEGLAVVDSRVFETSGKAAAKPKTPVRATAPVKPAAAKAAVERSVPKVGRGVSGTRSDGVVKAPAEVADKAELFVNFRRGSADLEGGVTSDMRGLAKALSDSLAAGNKRVIQIAGHTDATGDEATNLKLSDDRAQAVRKALMDLGVPAEAIQAVGYGETKLIDGFAPTHGVNRRVEVVFVN